MKDNFHLSERCSLGEHSVPDVPVQRSFADDIHFSLQEVFEVLLKGYMIHQARPWFHLYEDVQVAFGPGFASGDGAEDPKVMGTVLCGYG